MTSWQVTWQGVVERDWLDELDHVNFLAYQRIADKGGEVFWTGICGGRDCAQREGVAFVMVETLVRYLGELRLGDIVVVETALLAFDDKRYQLQHRISNQHQLACVVETVNLAFDPGRRRSMCFTTNMRARLSEWLPPADARAELPLKRIRTVT